MNRVNPLRTLAALALLPGLVSAQVKVWVVDALGQGDFSTIQGAIQSAAPGDTVFVHAGSYGSFTLEKGITVTAAEGAEVEVSGFTVAGLSAAQSAVVRGIRATTVALSGNSGLVWLEE